MTQNEALAILKTGTNVFLTGEPGSGKTHVVNCFVAWLRERGIEPAVTASTGIAATHINGHTIHSWSGIGVRDRLEKQDLERIASNERVARSVRSARTLVIDEISMLSARTFAMVEVACRAIRGGGAPFGGLQVVLVGDFFQLPPVVARAASGGGQTSTRFAAEARRVSRGEAGNPRSVAEREENCEIGEGLFGAGIAEAQSLFAFSSPAWRALNLNVCYLSEHYRQDDQAFLDILSAIRSGAVSADHRALLETRLARQGVDGITQFFAHNADVDRVNNAKLLALPGGVNTFVMESRGPKQLTARLMHGCLSPETLTLKIGARVMFTKNDIGRRRFVNGTLGTVSGFRKENGYPMVKTNTGRTIFAEPAEWSIEEGGRILARISQIPLRLAWAITVHKSQGMSLDAAHMDLSDAFEHGQGYVAISRVRTLAGLSLAGFNERSLEVHPKIKEIDAEFRDASRTTQENFAKIPARELERRQNDFIRACGGSVKPVKKNEREDDDISIIVEDARKKRPRWEQTLELVRAGKTADEAARAQNRKPATILQHIEELLVLEKISRSDLAHLARGKETAIAEIHGAFQKLGVDRLKPAYDHFSGRFSYEIIRLARLLYCTEA